MSLVVRAARAWRAPRVFALLTVAGQIAVPTLVSAQEGLLGAEDTAEELVAA